MASSGASTRADHPCPTVTATAAEVSQSSYVTVPPTAVDQLVFELVTSALYHRSRVSWFAGLHRVTMFINILAGTGAVAFIIGKDPLWSVVMSLLLAFMSSANLAFDFSGQARKHEEARHIYHDIAADLEESRGDEKAIKRLRARMIRAAAKEPIMFEAAEKVAFNAAIRSLNRDPAEEWVLGRRHRALRHIRPYSGTVFKQRKDIPERARAA